MYESPSEPSLAYGPPVEYAYHQPSLPLIIDGSGKSAEYPAVTGFE